jgi:hypothetical protein
VCFLPGVCFYKISRTSCVIDSDDTLVFFVLIKTLSDLFLSVVQYFFAGLRYWFQFISLVLARVDLFSLLNFPMYLRSNAN